MHDFTAGKIRVYLIDEHPIVREGFGRALADTPDIEVVGQAGTVDEALEEAASTSPDVILVDLNTPDHDGVELIGALRERMPGVKLLALSAYEDDRRGAAALRAGASGYLVKTSRIEEVTEGIRRVAAGGAALRPKSAAAVVRALRKSKVGDADLLDGLTSHQQEVLRLFMAWPARRRR